MIVTTNKFKRDNDLVVTTTIVATVCSRLFELGSVQAMTKQHETRPALWALACTTNNSQEKRPVEAPAFFGLPEATRTSRAGEVRTRGARDLTCSATTMCPPPSRAFPVSTDVSRFSRPAATSERDVEIQRSLSKRPSLVSERTNAFRSRSESRKGSAPACHFLVYDVRCRKMPS